MKPVQVCVTHTRGESEQWGVQLMTVLLDNGRIFQQEIGAGGPVEWPKWTEIHGPWENKS